ncbi:hypothetical protein scyTo_0006316 [Scyliorhinus torazame]|uniref:Uncharacterized protein n=1 Tax=Scyliorhinus torazame TaxID=75743 RepID=A0A401PH68_SCYTO|nr:hypothetical protein [Scyliorhinus torazame]
MEESTYVLLFQVGEVFETLDHDVEGGKSLGNIVPMHRKVLLRTGPPGQGNKWPFVRVLSLRDSKVGTDW